MSNGNLKSYLADARYIEYFMNVKIFVTNVNYLLKHNHLKSIRPSKFVMCLFAEKHYVYPQFSAINKWNNFKVKKVNKTVPALLLKVHENFIQANNLVFNQSTVTYDRGWQAILIMLIVAMHKHTHIHTNVPAAVTSK